MQCAQDVTKNVLLPTKCTDKCKDIKYWRKKPCMKEMEDKYRIDKPITSKTRIDFSSPRCIIKEFTAQDEFLINVPVLHGILKQPYDMDTM